MVFCFEFHSIGLRGNLNQCLLFWDCFVFCFMFSGTSNCVFLVDVMFLRFVACFHAPLSILLVSRVTVENPCRVCCFESIVCCVHLSRFFAFLERSFVELVSFAIRDTRNPTESWTTGRIHQYHPLIDLRTSGRTHQIYCMYMDSTNANFEGSHHPPLRRCSNPGNYDDIDCWKRHVCSAR